MSHGPDAPPPVERPRGPRAERLGLALVLLLAAILLSRDLAEPWMGPPDYNGAVFATAARNHLRYGIPTTRLGVTLNDAPVPADRLVYYINHPPLVPLLVSGSFALFGQREWAARLVPILSSLGSVLLLFRLGSLLGRSGTPPGGRRRVGLLAALLFTLFPMTIVFGEMVAHEATTTLFMLATVLGYVEWRRGGRSAWLWGAGGAFVLGALSGWPAYYLAVVLPLHHIWASRPRRPSPGPFVFPALALAMFALHLAHIHFLVGGWASGELFAAFQRRAAGAAAPGEPPLEGPVPFVRLWIGRVRDLFTDPALLLAPLGAWVLLRHGTRWPGRWVPAALVAAGALHLLVFRQGAWVHPYWAFYLGPAVALLAAVGLDRVGWAGGRPVAAVLLVVLVALGARRGLQPYSGENPGFPELGTELERRVAPAEALLANHWLILIPTVRHYARRDARGPVSRGHWDGYGAIADSARLREVLAAHPRDSLAFVSEQGVAPEVDAWLERRYPWETFDVRGTRYRLYHIRPYARPPEPPARGRPAP